MSLLDEINDYLEDKDLNNVYYTLDNDTLNRLKQAIDPYLNSKFLIRMFLEQKDSFRNSVRSLTKVDTFGFERLSKSTYKSIFLNFKESLTKKDIPFVYYPKFFKEDTYPLKERVRLVTQGIDLTKIGLITKEEEKEIIESYQNAALLIIEHEFGFQVENFNEKLFQIILPILSHKQSIFYWGTATMEKFLIECNIRKFHNAVGIMDILKNGYIKSGCDFFQVKPRSASELSEYFYLLDNGSLNNLYHHVEEHYRFAFEKLKDSKFSNSLDRIVFIQEELKELKDKMAEFERRKNNGTY